MACGCKKNKTPIPDVTSGNTENTGISISKIVNYTLKTIGFLLMVILLPLINLYIIWVIFKSFVLDKDLDIKPLLSVIGDKLKVKEKEEEEIGDITVDYEYELQNLEIIR